MFATGFETGYTADELGPQKAGFELIGRGGVRLSEKWSAGPRTLNSFSTHGFPNLFMQVMWTSANFVDHRRISWLASLPTFAATAHTCS